MWFNKGFELNYKDECNHLLKNYFDENVINIDIV
jgi:hypothetical protein